MFIHIVKVQDQGTVGYTLFIDICWVHLVYCHLLGRTLYVATCAWESGSMGSYIDGLRGIFHI